jgi:hypothetical protein
MSYVMSTGENAGEPVNDTKEPKDWAKKTNEIYELKDDKGRIATIIMVEGQFETCQYSIKNCICNSYDLDDWIFISKVTKKIDELIASQKEKNKVS